MSQEMPSWERLPRSEQRAMWEWLGRQFERAYKASELQLQALNNLGERVAAQQETLDRLERLLETLVARRRTR